jgi:hypothetical protein
MEFHLQYTPTRPTLGDFQLEISGVPEHVRKKQEAERKFQEAEQQRSDTLMAEMMAKLDQIFERQNTRLQNQQWSSQHAKAPKFPQLDSAVLEEWCCRAEEYFAYHRTPDEHRVSLSTFHLEGTIREMQWFQNIRWSKRVTTWDEFVRILHTRYSVPEKVEEHDNFKNEDEEKEDDAATQTVTPESVQDPIEDTKQIITPEPDLAEATQHKIIPTTNPAQDTNHIQIPEPVQAGNIGQTEIPATSPLIPKPKTSESIVEMSFSDRSTYCASISILHYRCGGCCSFQTPLALEMCERKKKCWDVAAEADAPTCRCRWSRAEQRIGGPRNRVGGGRLGRAPPPVLFSCTTCSLDVKQDEEETTVDLIEEPRSCDVAVGYWALKYCGGSVVERIYTFPREDEETNLEEQKLQSRCGPLTNISVTIL